MTLKGKPPTLYLDKCMVLRLLSKVNVSEIQMSEHELNMDHYIEAVRSISAVKLAEIGGESPALTEKLIGSISWAPKAEIHALLEFKDSSTEARFDSLAIEAGNQTSIEFELKKYVGSETEKMDAMIGVGEFDACYVSSAKSDESLLGLLMCCHASLRSGGIIGIDQGIFSATRFANAIDTFHDMYAVNYRAFAGDTPHILLKS